MFGLLLSLLEKVWEKLLWSNHSFWNVRFSREVAGLVDQIPKGKVSTYGDIARALGDVVASRTVYAIIRNTVDGTAPVHRVVTASGEAPYSRHLQILKDEGIPVSKHRVRNVPDHLFVDFESSQILVKLRKVQEALAPKVSLEDGFQKANTIGGIDVAYQDDKAFAACVVLDSKGTKIIEERRLSGEVVFPYVSTYLTFRELPMVKRIWGRLSKKPDVLMIDGNGILHPRGIGIASHAGLELDTPTIGVTKRLLMGKLGKVPKRIGDFGSIIHSGKVIGMALKTTKSDNYIYISPGHRVSMKTALELSKQLCFHRIPEPVRRAHRMAAELRRSRTK